MTRYVVALLTFIYPIVCGAATYGVPCESLRDLKNPNPRLCVCTESLSKLPITIPDGFSLTAACNFHQPYGDDVLGNYTFHGNVVLSGLITWGDDFEEEGGPYLQFSDDRKIPYSQFRSATSALTFRDAGAVAKQIKAPRLTRASKCWEAPVKIDLSDLVADIGHGTDTEGIFAEQFKILRVGKFSRCKRR